MGILPSGLPDEIAGDEDLARFLVQSKQFKDDHVKPSLFLPSKRDRETSVSRHAPEPAAELWKIGLVAAGTRNLYGAAILKAESVRAAGLEVYPDEPPDRHAAIRGWPWVDEDEVDQKAKQLERATLLASAAGKPLLRGPKSPP